MPETKKEEIKVTEKTATSFKPAKKKLSPKEEKAKREKRVKKLTTEAEESAKKKEMKQMSANKKQKETKQVPDKVKLAQKTPFGYYYNVSKDMNGNLVYCNIYQYMNDKKLGRIFQFKLAVIFEPYKLAVVRPGFTLNDDGLMMLSFFK